MSEARRNATYIAAAALSADITGAAITLLDYDEGELSMRIQVHSVAGTPNGLLSLQGTTDGGTTWEDISGAFSELPGTTAAALTAHVRRCVWAGLNFDAVRLKYTRTSGGTNDTLSAQYRVR